eukprot:gene17698-15117_t
MTYLPKYLDEELDFDIQSAGLLAALPFLLQCVLAITAGRMSERLAHHMSIRSVRLIMELTSLAGAAAFLTATAFISDNRSMAVASMTIATGFTGVASAGYNPNFMDISPYYAGRLYGISNTI